jgi:signal transduction histidine kinase
MEEAHYIGSLVHNLGLAAKLDVASPSLDRGPTDLNALIRRVVARHRTIADERGVSLDFGLPEQAPHLAADLTLLEQAISNIVYNAVRYNRPGGHAAVLVDILEVGGERQFRVRVIDDGPGVAAPDLLRLTERGFRGPGARSRAPEGQGLGLHVAARAASLHGFTLEFSRAEQGGLQVDLTGPLPVGSG